MTDIKIRTATLDDAAIITDFMLKMAKETENKDLVPDTVLKGVSGIFHRPKYGRYLVAYLAASDDQDEQQSAGSNSDIVIGTLLNTYEMSPKLGGLIHWIQSVYVVPEYRSRGAFRQLFQKSIQEAKQDPLGKAVRLYVDTDNQSAMKVYEKMGMSKLEESNFYELDLHFSH